jgi:hypothetical protein
VAQDRRAGSDDRKPHRGNHRARRRDGGLYQRTFCPLVDLRSSSLVQFVATLIVLIPLAFAFEDTQVRWSWTLAGAIAFLVIGASILAVSVLHLLMRRG